jgi:hypothetical protein
VEGIRLADPLRVHLAELSRCLAVEHRSEVLGTDDERRTSVLPHLPELLVLDEWHHPDLSGGELPSDTETFRRLAELLAAPATGTYRATEPPNTHWSSWPHGGSL